MIIQFADVGLIKGGSLFDTLDSRLNMCLSRLRPGGRVFSDSAGFVHPDPLLCIIGIQNLAPLILSLSLHLSGSGKDISTSSSCSPSGYDAMALLVTGFHIRVNSASRGATMGKVW